MIINSKNSNNSYRGNNSRGRGRERGRGGNNSQRGGYQGNVQISPVMATVEPPAKNKIKINVIIVKKIMGTTQLNARIHEKKQVITITTKHTWLKTRMITDLRYY